MQENPFEKSFEFGIALKQSPTCYKEKTEIFLVIRLSFAENLILIFDL